MPCESGIHQCQERGWTNLPNTAADAKHPAPAANGPRTTEINEALCVECAQPVYGLCVLHLTGVKIDGCVCVQTVHTLCVSYNKGLSHTRSGKQSILTDLSRTHTQVLSSQEGAWAKQCLSGADSVGLESFKSHEAKGSDPAACSQ